MGSNRLEDLTPDTRRVAEKLIQLASLRGIKIKVVSTLRSCEDQAKIYASNTPEKKVTGASGCRSWHTWGRAVDVIILDENGKMVPGSDHKYDELGDIGKSLGMIWGGNFSWGRDAGHFEYHPGLSINDLCPDSSNEACQEQISKHNAQNSQPVDVVLVNGAQNSNDLSMSKIIVSALIGSLVYQVINRTLSGGRK